MSSILKWEKLDGFLRPDKSYNVFRDMKKKKKNVWVFLLSRLT